MHKNGKQAAAILALQEADGKWGCFHSLSQSYGAKLTTEQALRRLEVLGFTVEDECIRRAVGYMEGCLSGRLTIPDRPEKVHDWKIFTGLILSAWIRRFTTECAQANEIAQGWASVISAAFSTGKYDHGTYLAAYKDILHPDGGRILHPYDFYHISLVTGLLDSKSESVYLDSVINNENGIYYIYDRKLSVPPAFEGKTASRYLGAIELLVPYASAAEKLGFVTEWIENSRMENGMFDLGINACDKVWLPLSDNWRSVRTRIADCTERVTALLGALEK